MAYCGRNIENPVHLSFETQLYSTNRAIEYYELAIKFYSSPGCKYLQNPAKECLNVLQAKKKVLENLIKVYGPNPSPNTQYGAFKATVYGDRFDRACPIEKQMKGQYSLFIRPAGSGLYYAHEFYSRTRLFASDGNGKYKFVRSEKK